MKYAVGEKGKTMTEKENNNSTSQQQPKFDQKWYNKLKEWFKSLSDEGKIQLVMTVFTTVMVVVTAVMVGLTYQSNRRAEKLFVGQNKPLIDVTPIAIIPTEDPETKGKFATTFFSITNYSGFVAKNIRLDLKYIENGNYIEEWLKADNENENIASAPKDEEAKIKIYQLTPSKNDVFIKELRPGKTSVPDKTLIALDKNLVAYDKDLLAKGFTGQLDLEKQVCSKGSDGVQASVRVTWENEYGHVFDEVRKYKLLCTKAGERRSYTFIPEE